MDLGDMKMQKEKTSIENIVSDIQPLTKGILYQQADFNISIDDNAFFKVFKTDRKLIKNLISSFSSGLLAFKSQNTQV